MSRKGWRLVGGVLVAVLSAGTLYWLASVIYRPCQEGYHPCGAWPFVTCCKDSGSGN